MLALFSLVASWCATAAVAADEQIVTDYLVLPAVGNYGKASLHRDAVEALLVGGQWQPPSEGDEVAHVLGDRRVGWEEASAADDGQLDSSAIRGGYAWASVDMAADEVMLLEAQGHATVYVNGDPRPGDPYSLGWLSLPVHLQEGANELLFHVASTQMSARLVPPESDVFWDARDATLPTLVRGEEEVVWGAMPLVNASLQTMKRLRVACQVGDGEALITDIGDVQRITVRKVPFQIPAAAAAIDEETADEAFPSTLTCRLRLLGPAASEAQSGDAAEQSALAEVEFELRIVGPRDIHVRTFRSQIDGSVQPYAVRPAIAAAGIGESTEPAAADSDSEAEPVEEDRQQPPGVILTLHAAGVTCEEQAALYEPKSWAHVVAPMGRRPYGFDWEDWGRIDALEALADAARHYPHDPRRVTLTGSSMGGHGAWHLGVTYPDRFAAIGINAGWISYWSYGGGMPFFESPTPVEEMLLHGYSPSDTLKLLPNLKNTGLFLSHGVDNQQVPVSQAHFMRSRLGEFHSNFVYLEEPESDPRSAVTADDPRMMDFLRRQSSPPPEEVDSIDFMTASPGISGKSYWVTIANQEDQLRPSRVAIRRDRNARAFIGRTINVSRLGIEPSNLRPGRTLTVELDGQRIPRIRRRPGGGTLWFERREDQWVIDTEPESTAVKDPERYGTLKSAFDNDVLLVYGTSGTEEERRWSYAKARYDAETFWYRGNGGIEIVADVDFRPAANPDRNVVIYGNAQSNRAWPVLLSTCPVQVRRGQVTIGSRPEAGDDLAVLFVRPRAGSERAVVAVVGGTGIAGMRLTNRLRYFVAGVAYPDFMIYGPASLTEGTIDIRTWGYFGPDWKLDDADLAWRDMAL